MAYPYRKSQYAPRIYAKGAVGVAANTTFKWANANAVAGGYMTSHMCMTAEAPYTGIQLVFGNEDAVTYPISSATVAPGATLNDLSNSAATGRTNFTAVTFAGSTSGVVPAGTSAKPGLLVSDVIAINSVARAAGDSPTWTIAGGKLSNCDTLPLLHVRVAQPTPTTTSNLLGTITSVTCTDAPFNPPQPTKSGRFLSVKHAAASTDQTSAGGTAALTGTTYGPYSATLLMPIIGIIFRYPNGAMSWCGVGDSIEAGAGIVGSAGDSRPFNRIASEYASTPTNPIEFCQMALAGTSTSTFEAYFENIVTAGILPTHAFMPAFSPNDGGNFTGMTTAVNKFLATCATNNICPVISTGMPVGLIAPQKLNATSEAARNTYNNAIRAGTQFGKVGFLELDLAVNPSTGQAFSDLGAGDATNHIASFTTSPDRIGDTTYNLHPTYIADGVIRGIVTNRQLALASDYFAASDPAGAITLSSFGVSSSGSVSTPVAGTIDITISPMSMTATAVDPESSSISMVLGAFSMASSAGPVAGGTLASLLDGFTMAITASDPESSSVSLVLSDMSLNSIGDVVASGSAGILLDSMMIDAEAILVGSSTMNLRLASVVSAGSGSPSVSGDASSFMSPFTMSGVGIDPESSSLGVTLSDFVMTASGNVTAQYDGVAQFTLASFGVDIEGIVSGSTTRYPTLSEIVPSILNGIFNRRVWENATPDDLPRDTAGKPLPFCVWTVSGGMDSEYIDQTMPDHVHARVQLHVCSTASNQAELLAYQARDALLTSTYTVGVYGSPVGAYDAVRKLHGKRQQFSIWFRQPQGS